MASISKNAYMDKLDDIVNKYCNTYYGTIKMKPVNVKSSTYTDFGIENNDKDPKCKVADYAIISKYENIFVKDYVLNCSEEVFVIKKANIFQRTHHVESTSIRRRYYIDTSMTKFCRTSMPFPRYFSM